MKSWRQSELCSAPADEATLLARCRLLEGMTVAQLAQVCEAIVPHKPTQRKGFVGQILEKVLGATASQQAKPDFLHLGIELKTIPLSHNGKPQESTFVTSIPLLTIHQQVWQTSSCYAKLKRVLWVPVEGDQEIPFPYRRIGKALLWSANAAQAEVLAKDWEELVLLLSTGKIAQVDSSMGEYLQVRPKALSGRSLCYAFDEVGNKVLTLPRGFYLRATFTASLLADLR